MSPAAPDPVASRSFLIKLAAAITLSLVVGSGLLALVLVLLNEPDDALANADPGRTAETLYEWEGPIPPFTDVTELWGLAEWRNTSERNASGGVVLIDLDQDGFLDVALAGGEPEVYFGNGGVFTLASGDLSMDAVALTAGDLDGDGRLDLVFGADGREDVIVWGGEWLDDRDLDQAEISSLASGEPTTGVLIADLTGDGLADLLRLGYGNRRPSADVIYQQVTPRQFVGVPLPDSERRSLAAEVAQLDDAGGPDVWVTRDVGWRDGGDSIYSRRGSIWTDIAPGLGAALEIDGMGVTLADLSGDAELDAYLSDLGENDFLEWIPESGYAPTAASGAGRIRPPGAPVGLISSTWASGVADLNLDGVLDLVAVNGGFPGQAVANKVPGTAIVDDDPPAILLGLGDGRYADVWAALGLEWHGAGRGLALGDLDGDGDVDLAITTRDEGLTVLRNDAASPGSLIALESTCDGAGVEVTVETSVGNYHLLAAPHTFLGRHAPGVIVGGEVLEVRLVAADGRQFSLSSPSGSSTLVGCRDLR